MIYYLFLKCMHRSDTIETLTKRNLMLLVIYQLYVIGVREKILQSTCLAGLV